MMLKNNFRNYLGWGVLAFLLLTFFHKESKTLFGSSPIVYCIDIIYLTVFILVTLLLSKNHEKKFIPLRNELAKVRTIICEGPTNYLKGIIFSGGWLFLSKDALEFYPIKNNPNSTSKAFYIPLDDITNVNVFFSYLLIQTKMKKYIFTVNHSYRWKKEIQGIL